MICDQMHDFHLKVRFSINTLIFGTSIFDQFFGRNFENDAVFLYRIGARLNFFDIDHFGHEIL